MGKNKKARQSSSGEEDYRTRERSTELFCAEVYLADQFFAKTCRSVISTILSWLISAAQIVAATDIFIITNYIATPKIRAFSRFRIVK